MQILRSDRPQSAVSSSGPRPLLLIAEDNPDDQLLLQRALRKAAVVAEVRWAKDGLEAKTILEETLRVGGRLPACIVTDLKMPLMDGFELLAFVKSDPDLRSLPVVVLSTSMRQEDLRRAYALGANSYLVKPSTFEALLGVAAALGSWWAGTNSGLNPRGISPA